MLWLSKLKLLKQNSAKKTGRVTWFDFSSLQISIPVENELPVCTTGTTKCAKTATAGESVFFGVSLEALCPFFGYGPSGMRLPHVKGEEDRDLGWRKNIPVGTERLGGLKTQKGHTLQLLESASFLASVWEPLATFLWLRPSRMRCRLWLEREGVAETRSK